MKINMLFLTLALTISSVNAAPTVTAATASPVSTQSVDKKAIVKANLITGLKGFAFVSLGYYVSGFSLKYLGALVKSSGATDFKYIEVNDLNRDFFLKGVYILTGVWGLYLTMRATGNVSEFDENDIDAGFMGAGAGRDSAKSR